MAKRRHKRKKVAPGPAMAVGSPFPIKLGEEEFMATSLTIDDFGQFENWVKSQRVAHLLRGFEALGNDLTFEQEERQGRMIQGITISALSPVDLVNEMSSMSGALYIIWLSLRHKHPDLQLSELKEKVQNSGSVLDIVTKVSGLFNYSDGAEDEKRSDPKTKDGQTGQR